jgi:hypothetical protein
MKRPLFWGFLMAIFALAAAGCATAPQVTKGASNFIQKGTVSPKLKGNDFYMAIGEADLYTYGIFGGLTPSGKTVEIAVVIQADKDSGEVLKIATMQSNEGVSAEDSQNGVTVANGAKYVLADLRGGMSLIDVQPYPRWLDAIQAMRDAIAKLSTYTSFAVSEQSDSSPVVVAVSAGWGWGWGWGWWGHGWRGVYRHRRYYW